MNTDGDEPITPRWLKSDGPAGRDPASPAERAVLAEVLRAIRQVRFGGIQIAIQDGRVVQIDVTEKRRL